MHRIKGLSTITQGRVTHLLMRCVPVWPYLWLKRSSWDWVTHPSNTVEQLGIVLFTNTDLGNNSSNIFSCGNSIWQWTPTLINSFLSELCSRHSRNAEISFPMADKHNAIFPDWLLQRQQQFAICEKFTARTVGKSSQSTCSPLTCRPQHEAQEQDHSK